MTEEQLQAAIIDAARALGWLVYHTRDSRRSAAGFPDLVLVDRGRASAPRLIFAELKSETGKLSDDQLAWGSALASVAAIAVGLGPSDVRPELPALVSYYVWRPADWRAGRVDEALRARL